MKIKYNQVMGEVIFLGIKNGFELDEQPNDEAQRAFCNAKSIVGTMRKNKGLTERQLKGLCNIRLFFGQTRYWPSEKVYTAIKKRVCEAQQ